MAEKDAKKVDWGTPPPEFDIDISFFDLKHVMSQCYPFHPVALRWGDLVFELQLVSWPDDAHHRDMFSNHPERPLGPVSPGEFNALIRRKPSG